MILSADELYAWLLGLEATLADTGLSLSDALTLAIKDQYQTLKTGQIIVGTSGNGASVQFDSPGAGKLSPQATLAVLGRLKRLYTAATTALGGTPTDAQIIAQMAGYMRPIREYRNRYDTLGQWESV